MDFFPFFYNKTERKNISLSLLSFEKEQQKDFEKGRGGDLTEMKLDQGMDQEKKRPGLYFWLGQKKNHA